MTVNYPSEEEFQYVLDAVAFCTMLERDEVSPITYNENLACLLHRKSGAVFTANQWRQIVSKYSPKKGDPTNVPKGYGTT